MGISSFSSKDSSNLFLKKEKKSPEVKLKLYEQTLEQVSIIRYLGAWMDSKLKEWTGVPQDTH